ncbi:DUF4126 domain-containing protein [Planktothrix paucivesiculata]|uniref:DUF4126 domain-containing protein n=1 Tax=Planktothrix paucivesiculata PCC 9631 TaxID=671071 RepID=A0A7Z9BVR6_9CYAN|nr:DUF4126 domain-containing protein [Planktothrix paucivesiculata]VXD23649.1 conserved membrane hypothetical protein [Planktothrix paucivesiculata PCC 9631]
MIELLAVLSASAAAGLRIAIPLLVIGLLRNDLWSSIPFLSQFSPQVVVGVLVSWSLFEIFASKKLLGQRILQLIQLLFSPFVGAILGLAIAQATNVQPSLYWIIAIVAGLLALVLQLVQTGLFYRLRGLPLWVILGQDILCVFLVIFAFDAPQQGGLIALLLLWLSIRISKEWYRWYRKQANPEEPNPRRYKREPD